MDDVAVPQQCWRRRIDREVHQQTSSLDLSLDLNLKTNTVKHINGLKLTEKMQKSSRILNY